MASPNHTFETIHDPALAARLRSIRAQGRRNSKWLASAWPTLLPQAAGKYVAVGGQEAFIAEDALEAEALAKAAHPEDEGVVVQFVTGKKGPLIGSCHVRIKMR